MRLSTFDGLNEQLWMTPSMTLRNGELERYVRMGNRMIARITGEGRDSFFPDPIGCAIVPMDGEPPWAGGLRFVLLIGGLLSLTLGAGRSRRRAREWLYIACGLLALGSAHLGCTSLGSKHQAVWQTTSAVYFHQGIAPGPVLFTRMDGSIFAERRYEPFGDDIDERIELSDGSFSVGDVDFAREPFNILNKETDPSTGWSYHGARWMAPETARWLTPDPPVKGPDPKFLAEPWSLHPYQYVNQNPVVYWDPDGAEGQDTAFIRHHGSAACRTQGTGCGSTAGRTARSSGRGDGNGVPGGQGARDSTGTQAGALAGSADGHASGAIGGVSYGEVGGATEVSLIDRSVIADLLGLGFLNDRGLIDAPMITPAEQAAIEGAEILWTIVSGAIAGVVSSLKTVGGGGYAPKKPLARDQHGRPVSKEKSGPLQTEPEGAHTQLGTRTSKKRGDTYRQGREFDADGNHVRDVDFTDHGRPKEHPNPHQHRIDPETGKRGRAEPL
jgi:RHS repeat-associated protein